MSCAGIAQAQSSSPIDPGNVITLDEALAQAGASSPATEAADFGIRAAEAGRSVAALRPNPTVSMLTENIGNRSPYRAFNSAETTVDVALPIELGGKRSARIGVADARTTRARLEAAIARADVRLRVTQAYVDAAASERRLTVAQERLRITGEALRVASERVLVGATFPIDEQRASVQQINAQTAVERATRAVDVARGNLGRLVGAPITTGLDQRWFERTATIGPDIPIRANGTLAYAAATSDLAIANAGVRLARSQRVPDLTITTGARRLEATNDTVALVGVSIPLPLFNNGRASILQANAERDQFAARRKLASLDAEQAIASARAERDNAAASVRASGPTLAAATEAARIARIGYGQGKFDQIILLDAERTLAETRAQAIDALVQFHDAEAQLVRLTAPAPDLSGDTQ